VEVWDISDHGLYYGAIPVLAYRDGGTLFYGQPFSRMRWKPAFTEYSV
jgi:hypothetical protein